jgi:Ca2+-binding EF-hand superfamily protein
MADAHRGDNPPAAPPTSGAKRPRKKLAKSGTRQSDSSAIDAIFAAFDVHGNRRIVREDVRRVADQHGVDLTGGELAMMLKFWDGSGTATMSRADFGRLCREAGV